MLLGESPYLTLIAGPNATAAVSLSYAVHSDDARGDGRSGIFDGSAGARNDAQSLFTSEFLHVARSRR
jgi:hypothetical protein